jgi:hypothetical protein
VRNRCAKCLGLLEAGEYVVNKDMAYCGDCAALLHLGESKESRMFRDFQDDPEAVLAPASGPATETDLASEADLDPAEAVLEEGAILEG